MSEHGTLLGKNVLVVENEWLIADDLRRSLASEGARVLGPVASVDQALALIDKTVKIDAAVLDIHLNGGSDVYAVAERLRELDIPFMFATGYDQLGIRCDFAEVPHVTKPFQPSSLGGVLATIAEKHIRRDIERPHSSAGGRRLYAAQGAAWRR